MRFGSYAVEIIITFCVKLLRFGLSSYVLGKCYVLRPYIGCMLNFIEASASVRDEIHPNVLCLLFLIVLISCWVVATSLMAEKTNV